MRVLKNITITNYPIKYPIFDIYLDEESAQILDHITDPETKKLMTDNIVKCALDRLLKNEIRSPEITYETLENVLKEMNSNRAAILSAHGIVTEDDNWLCVERYLQNYGGRNLSAEKIEKSGFKYSHTAGGHMVYKHPDRRTTTIPHQESIEDYALASLIMKTKNSRWNGFLDGMDGVYNVLFHVFDWIIELDERPYGTLILDICNEKDYADLYRLSNRNTSVEPIVLNKPIFYAEGLIDSGIKRMNGKYTTKLIKPRQRMN